MIQKIACLLGFVHALSSSQKVALHLASSIQTLQQLLSKLFQCFSLALIFRAAGCLQYDLLLKDCLFDRHASVPCPFLEA